MNDTYNRIKTRAKDLAKNSGEGGGGEEVEQIQLHATDPSTKINIKIPNEGSSDSAEAGAREAYDQFPPGLQRALQSESLDEVNKVLGKMSVDEAEEVVEKLGESGILTLEEGIVDATTEEGKKWLEHLEEEEKAEATEGGEKATEKEDIGEPAS